MTPPPSNLDYIRAHQYLYYVVNREVLSDRDYDTFGRDSGEDYKGGSDNPSHYSEAHIVLAAGILARNIPALPTGPTA